jgi:hypothetical protein
MLPTRTCRTPNAAVPEPARPQCCQARTLTAVVAMAVRTATAAGTAAATWAARRRRGCVRATAVRSTCVPAVRDAPEPPPYVIVRAVSCLNRTNYNGRRATLYVGWPLQRTGGEGILW